MSETMWWIFIGVVTVAVAVILKAIYNTIAEKRYNDSQPILTENTKISGKRTEMSGGGDHSVSTCYFATFELAQNKKRIELEIDSDDYGSIAEQDSGKLTFQGRRFIRFERTL